MVILQLFAPQSWMLLVRQDALLISDFGFGVAGLIVKGGGLACQGLHKGLPICVHKATIHEPLGHFIEKKESLSLTFNHFNYNLCGSLWVHLFWNSLGFLDLKCCCLPVFKKVFWPFLFSFWAPCNANFIPLDVVPKVP